MQCLYKAVKKKSLMAEKKDERFITIRSYILLLFWNFLSYCYCSETFDQTQDYDSTFRIFIFLSAEFFVF